MAKAFAVTENTPDYGVIHLYLNQGAAKKKLAELENAQKEDPDFDDDEVEFEMNDFKLTDGTAYGHKSEGSIEYGDAPEDSFEERKEDAAEYSEWGAVVDLAKHKYVQIYVGSAIEVAPSKASVFIYEADEISEHVKQNKTIMKHVKLFEAFVANINEAKVNLKKEFKNLENQYDASFDGDIISIVGENPFDDGNEYTFNWDGTAVWSDEDNYGGQEWSSEVTSVDDFTSLIDGGSIDGGDWQ